MSAVVKLSCVANASPPFGVVNTVLTQEVSTHSVTALIHGSSHPPSRNSGRPTTNFAQFGQRHVTPC
jgi:hypothetical protein